MSDGSPRSSSGASCAHGMLIPEPVRLARWITYAPRDLAADRLEQRPCEDSSQHEHLPARLDVDARLDQQLRVLLDSRIAHETTFEVAAVRMRGPSAVIATLCSKCAASEWSALEIDHSSSCRTTSGPPAVIIGSIAKVMPSASSGPRPGSP